MPIYMDIHTIPGVKAKNVAEAHLKDLAIQEDYGCKCMTYWIDEKRESVFCLIDAPDKDAVEELHGKAHGLIPNKIIEVSSKVVESFLGRIFDPPDATVSETGLKVFSDAALRTLLVTTIEDPVLLELRLGKEKANELIRQLNLMVRKKIAEFEGSEAEHKGTGFIVSFTAAANAVSCALAIRKDLPVHISGETGLKLALHAGEPVAKSPVLFGDTIQMAANLCVVNKSGRIAITSAVQEIVSREVFLMNKKEFFMLSPQEENLLSSIFSILEMNWEKTEFSVEDFGRTMAMSTSQLYRTSVKLTGQTPNTLLKEFRLEKAKELLKKKLYSVSQITFESGFSSPSYFTKCFKKEYGLLPVDYLNLLG
jgi:AraC-like DNA-binding protein